MSIGNSDIDAISPSLGVAQQRRFGFYDLIGTSKTVEGVTLILPWAALEGSTRGDYSVGRALLKAELAKLKSLPVPKRLFLRMKDNPSGAASKFFPAYFIAADCTVAREAGGKTPIEWRKWDSKCRGDFDRLLDAYAWLDDEPYFEGLYIVKESALGGNSLPTSAGYTLQGYRAGLLKMAAKAKSVFPTSNVIVPVNHLAGGTNVRDLIAELTKLGVGWGNPDTCPDCRMDGDEVILGKIGDRDYRGHLPLLITVEASELGYDSVGRAGGYTPAQLFNYANGTLRVSHMMWHRNEYTGTTEQRWSTGILPFINANPMTNPACPKLYAACKK